MPNQSISTQEANDAFDDFLFLMDDQIEGLQREGMRHGVSLDMTDASIGRLERLFDLLVPDKGPEAGRSGHVVLFGRYLGEVMRLRHGGRWHLPLDDPKNIYFNQPTISGHRPGGILFAPISVMRAYALRRQSGTVLKAYQTQANPNPKPLNLDDLIED
jgi:hypothetical protein